MDLEKIIYDEDSGTAAIQKLDRNQRKIGNKVETINIDGLEKQINVLIEKFAIKTKTANLTSIVDGINSISDNSILLGNYTGTEIEGSSYSYTILIQRYNGVRTQILATKTGTTDTFIGTYRSDGTLKFAPIATKTKTSFSLGAGTGYMIISQNCYIQNGQTYINVLIKKIDGSAFGTGNLYIAASNTIPAGVFPCASIGYKNVSGENVPSAIPNFIQATVASKNIMISNTVADLKAIAINAIIG